MKYLNDYTEQAQNAAMEKASAFFCFSERQLQEGLDKHGLTKDQVCSMGMGLVAPKDTADQLAEDLKQAYENGVQADLAENGVDSIIVRELHNHECFYTASIEPCTEKLKDYGITENQILRAYSRELDKQREAA